VTWVTMFNSPPNQPPRLLTPAQTEKRHNHAVFESIGAASILGEGSKVMNWQALLGLPPRGGREV
jgi:hypothetical protein